VVQTFSASKPGNSRESFIVGVSSSLIRCMSSGTEGHQLY
jgi:hypothetical protein